MSPQRCRRITICAAAVALLIAATISNTARAHEPDADERRPILNTAHAHEPDTDERRPILNTAHAHEPDADERRPILVTTEIDNSGSMRHHGRFRRAVRALQRWLESLDSRMDITIEILTAADTVVPRGEFRLGDGASLSRVLDSLDELETQSSSRTIFRKIDEGTADFVAAHVRPNQVAGLVFVTDGISDAPENDLRLEDLGDEVLPLGDGLYAVISGVVPAQEAIKGTASNSRTIVSQREPARAPSRCRRLFAPSIAISVPRSISKTLRRHLLGSLDPVFVAAIVENSGDIAREVQIEVELPPGAAGRVEPDRVVLAPRSKTTVGIEISAISPVSGTFVTRVQEPDGSTAKWGTAVDFVAGSWWAGNKFALAGFGMSVAVTLALLLAVARRKWFVMPLGRSDRGFWLGPGEEVSLNAADPDFPPGTWVARRRGGLWVRTEDKQLRVGSATARPGHDVRVRPRAPIECDHASVVLDRRSRRDAARQPPNLPFVGNVSRDGLL